MKKVLVSGATGFIGRHCLPLLLASGYEVHAVSSRLVLSRRNWIETMVGENLSDVRWHQANLLNSKQIIELITHVQPTHLLHFAWYAKPGDYWTSLENLRWLQASLDLLQAFAQRGGQRVVMAGTCAEYDWKYGYCSEQITPLLPTTLYGICKHSLQILLDAFTKQTGLSGAWGRIFFLYGPYEHPDRLVPSVIRSVLRGELARCSHGNQIRDFLHVQDVAEAFVSLLTSDVSGPVNIASGRPVILKEIIYKIAEKLGRSDLIQLGTLPTPTNDPRLVVANISRLSDEVNWLPKYDLDRGLEQTISWWKSQLFACVE